MSKIPYRYAVALTAALGLFMAVLDNTIVNVALNDMQKSFAAKDPTIDINTIEWVITGYFLAQAAIIPVAGYLSNRFGIKRMFILALALFTLGSLLCGMSEQFDSWFGGGGVTLLIAFRVFQGIGGGMLFPLATSISFNVFPPEERAASSAVIAVPVLLAPTLGPTVGGLIVDSSLRWPSIFFINVPIGLLAIFLIARILKPDTGQRPAMAGAGAGAGKPGETASADGGTAPVGANGAPVARRASFDFLGLILSIVGTVLIVYGINLISQYDPSTITANNPRGTIYGWGYWLVWALVVGGVALLGVFSYYELKIAKDPVLDLRLFSTGIFLFSTVMTWVLRAVVFGSFFILPLFLEQFQGKSAVETGLALMPQGLAAGIGIATGGRLYDRVGPRYLVILGMLALTLSSAMLIFTNKDTDAWSLVPILLIRGLGFGWSNLPLQTVALSKITGRALPKASSLYNATAQIFSSIGIAVLTTLFVQAQTSHIAFQRSQFTPAQLGALAKTPDALRQQLLSPAAASAVGDVFLAVTIGTALAILLAFTLPRYSLKQEQIRQGKLDPAQAEKTPSMALGE